MYHAETAQEDFFVVSGECLAIVEEQERAARQFDFLHCPPGTRHVFVGAGDEPCVLLMIGSRIGGRGIVYRVSEAALARGAGVEHETDSPHEAYAPFGHWQTGGPKPAALVVRAVVGEVDRADPGDDRLLRALVQPLAAAAHRDEELVEVRLERGEHAVGPVLHLEAHLAR